MYSQKKNKITSKTRIKLSLALRGNRNGLGKNLGNKNALGKVTGSNNGNWKGGKRTLAYKESIAGRKRPSECELCGAIGTIDFDHDHITGNFRGWLCRRCNLVLGMVKDNSELLLALSNYVSYGIFTNDSNKETS